MQNENPLTAAEQELERALLNLHVAPPGDARESIAYEAGRRAGRRAAVPWRLCSTTLAACLALSIFHQPQPRTITQFVPAPIRATPQLALLTDSRPIPGNYLDVRDQVLDHGLSALPRSSSYGSSDRHPTPHAISIQSPPFQLSSLLGGHS
ncbi:MAG TPA: hypothetical protein VFE58_19960 [Tepidisphaeraceae bacterium]|nr:hypothetical protein [Tepidisphaeraceae bacterium]